MRFALAKSLTLMLVNCLLVCVPAWAQIDFGTESGFEDPYFCVDYASFREAKSEKYDVEIYYKIYSPKLTFIKEKGKFVASFELNFTILHKGGKHVTAKSVEKSYAVSSYENSVSPDQYSIGIDKFSLYSGEYTLVAELLDHNSKRRSVLKKNFSLPSRLKGGLNISDIELCLGTEEVASSEDFVKSGRRLIPSVSGIFGERDSTMFVYFEIYTDPSIAQRHPLTYEIAGEEGDALKEEEDVEIAEGKLALAKKFNLQNLGAGDYALSIKLFSKDRELLAESDKKFRIDWSPLSLLKKDYDKAIQQLKYVAEEDEMKKLENTSVSDREAAWRDFWKSKDPSPNTDRNEMEDEYYKRLSYANTNFAVHNKEGWETDMGMVFIIYGYPDEVEGHFLDRESDRTEGEYVIWYYYRLRPEREFFFKDSGYGEYRLEFPYDGIQR